MLPNLKELTPIEGVNYRIDCPYCGGKNTFSMIREGGNVRHHCFRASCTNSRGTRRYSRTLEEISNSVRKRKENSENEKTFVIPNYFQFGIVNDKMVKVLKDRNSLDAIRNGVEVGYDPREERLLFFLKSSGQITGAVGRSLSFHIKPKSKIYPNSEGVFSAGEGSHAVLVEDCFSACSVSRTSGIVGVSLNGTNLAKEHLTFLKNYDMVTVALDKDATRKAIKLSKQLNFMGIKSKILYLQEDLKDCKILPDLT